MIIHFFKVDISYTSVLFVALASAGLWLKSGPGCAPPCRAFWALYISWLAAWNTLFNSVVAESIATKSWALWASFNLARAASIGPFLSAGSLSNSFAASPVKIKLSAWFSLSIRSFLSYQLLHLQRLHLSYVWFRHRSGRLKLRCGYSAPCL